MSNRLPILKAAISAAHFDVGRHLASAADRALVAGEMLVEAKDLCPHGTWSAWLADVGISERTAQRYMSLHRAGFKSAMVADLGMATCERYAAAARRLPLPEAGRAVCFAGRDPEPTVPIEALAYAWTAENELYWYCQCLVFGEETFEIVPKGPVPPWLLALLHDNDTKVTWHASDVPVAEAVAFREKIRRAA